MEKLTLQTKHQRTHESEDLDFQVSKLQYLIKDSTRMVHLVNLENNNMEEMERIPKLIQNKKKNHPKGEYVSRAMMKIKMVSMLSNLPLISIWEDYLILIMEVIRGSPKSVSNSLILT